MACICEDLLDEDGNGQCLKRDYGFGGKFSCIVKENSDCDDTIVKHNGLHFSALACEDKNEGMYQL